MRWAIVGVLALSLLGCGSAVQRSASGTAPSGLTSYVSTDGVRFRPGPGRDVGRLTPLSWRAVTFDRGRLALKGLAERRHRSHCHRPVLVQVGSQRGLLRPVVVWGDAGPAPCSVAHRRVELSPAGWTDATIATSYTVHPPNPRADRQLENTTIRGTAVLQSDHRTIAVDYTFGGCRELHDASAVRSGTRIVVRVVTGVAEQPADMGCPMFLAYATTVIKMAEAVPAGTTVTVAR